MSTQPNDDRALPENIAAGMMPVIRQIACNLARRLPRHVCVDDLMSVGFVGLVTAYRRFPSAQGDEFRAYAEVRIRGAMIDELRNGDPLSRGLRAHQNRAAAARRTVEARTGEAADEASIANEMGLSLDTYQSQAAKAAVGMLVSIDATTEGEPTMQLKDEGAVLPDEQLQLAEAKRAAREALEALPPRLRQVIELYYGSEMTLREIGEVLGVTESRVCQIQSEALNRMREHCRNSVAPKAPAVDNVRKFERPRRTSGTRKLAA